MRNYGYFLCIILLIGISRSEDINDLIGDLVNWPYSHYAIDGFYSFWWNITSADTIKIGVVCKNFGGYVGFGFSKTGKMVGSIAILGNLVKNEEIVESLNLKTKTNTSILPVKVDNLAMNTTRMIDSNGQKNQFRYLEFDWNISYTNPFYNFTFDTPTNLIYSYRDDNIFMHHNKRAFNNLTFINGSNAVPFRTCSFTCANGECPDPFTCKCQRGWEGIHCDKPVPPPPPIYFDHNITLTNVGILFWNITEDGNQLDIALQVEVTTGYIALGFNRDNGKMLGADAVIAWFDNDDGVNANIQAYNLTARVTGGPHPINNIFKISDQKLVREKGYTTLYFKREFATGQHQIEKNSENNVVISSFGPTPSNPTTIEQHRSYSEPIKLNWYTGKPIIIESYLRQYHGIAMAISWGIILPVGVLIARYLKQAPDSLWFKIHRITQPLGYIGTLVGFALILLHTNWELRISVHAVIGYALTICGLLQVIIAYFRPHPPSSSSKYGSEEKTKARIIWEYKHLYLGRLMVLTSFFTIPLGICKFATQGNELEISVCFGKPEFRPYLILHIAYVGIYIVFIIFNETLRILHLNRSQYRELG